MLVRGCCGADALDAADELQGAAVVEVVAVDGRDHHVAQAELDHGVGEIVRLVRIDCAGLAGGDVAEGASTGADIAQDHHRRVLLRPAFADVRAAGLLADGMQPVLADDPVRLAVSGRRRRLHPDPRRLAGRGIVRPMLLLRMAGGDVGDHQLHMDGLPKPVKHRRRFAVEFRCFDRQPSSERSNSAMMGKLGDRWAHLRAVAKTCPGTCQDSRARAGYAWRCAGTTSRLRHFGDMWRILDVA